MRLVIVCVCLAVFAYGAGYSTKPEVRHVMPGANVIYHDEGLGVDMVLEIPEDGSEPALSRPLSHFCGVQHHDQETTDRAVQTQLR